MQFLLKNQMKFLYNCIIESSPKKADSGHSTIIRNLTTRDLTEVIKIENSCWQVNLQASKANLYSRLLRFSKGSFGGFTKEGKLIAFATSQLVHLEEPHQFKIEQLPLSPKMDWMNLDTDANATIEQTNNINGNCLHFVSACVLPGYRGFGIWRSLIKSRIVLAKSLNLKYCAVLSRLDKYDHSGSDNIHNYLAKNIDGYLKVFNEFGFHPESILDVEKNDQGDKYWVLLIKNLAEK
jgi:GNAT superfamily N-acetyltransferase